MDSGSDYSPKDGRITEKNKMLSLVGCESPEYCVTLHRETKLRWNKGVLHEYSSANVRTI